VSAKLRGEYLPRKPGNARERKQNAGPWNRCLSPRRRSGKSGQIRILCPWRGCKGDTGQLRAVLAAALALVLLFVSSPIKESVPPAVKYEMPIVTQQPYPPPVEPKKEAPKAVPKKVPVPEPEALPPLYLTVPPERVIVPEQETYAVVKGDTLWGIAKRFTGNPFNYPRVARDNSIATPDLIFRASGSGLCRRNDDGGHQGGSRSNSLKREEGFSGFVHFSGERILCLNH